MTVQRQVTTRWPYHRWVGALTSVVALGALFVVPARPLTVKDDMFITAQTTGILDIEATECFDDPAYSRSANESVVRYKPCVESADNQSYGFVHAQDGPFDRTALAAYAWESCGRGFAHYWTSKAVSGLDFYPVMPTTETWADGDRDIMCVVYSPKGRLGGSMLPRHIPEG